MDMYGNSNFFFNLKNMFNEFLYNFVMEINYF